MLFQKVLLKMMPPKSHKICSKIKKFCILSGNTKAPKSVPKVQKPIELLKKLK